MNESALFLMLVRGWDVERTREYLRGNYINATCSAVEDAIKAAQQRMKTDKACTCPVCGSGLIFTASGQLIG